MSPAPVRTPVSNEKLERERLKERLKEEEEESSEEARQERSTKRVRLELRGKDDDKGGKGGLQSTPSPTPTRTTTTSTSTSALPVPDYDRASDATYSEDSEEWDEEL